MCVRHKLRCHQGNLGCTPQEQASGTVIWTYSVMGADFCRRILSNDKLDPLYKQSLSCCATPLCNRPMDRTRRVLPSISTMTVAASG